MLTLKIILTCVAAFIALTAGLTASKSLTLYWILVTIYWGCNALSDANKRG